MSSVFADLRGYDLICVRAVATQEAEPVDGAVLTTIRKQRTRLIVRRFFSRLKYMPSDGGNYRENPNSVR